MSDILNADMRTVTAWIDGGWRWWVGELGELVPLDLRHRLAARAVAMDYRADAGDLWPSDDAATRSSATLAVILPVGLCLVRTMQLPKMTQRDLDAMIALDGGRIMPFGASAMVLAGRIVQHDPATGRMQAEVAGLAHDDAKALGEALRVAARAPARVWVSAPQPLAPPPIDMLPALRRAGLVAAPDRSLGALWLAVGFLFALNIGLLIWRDAAAVDALQDMVTQQQPAVAAAHRIISRMHGVDQIADRTLAARRTSEPLAMLARIDHALPPGAWLQRLSWNQAPGLAGGEAGAVRLTGYSAARVDVSAALRHSGMRMLRYDDAANTADTPLGQPFDITARLETGRLEHR